MSNQPWNNDPKPEDSGSEKNPPDQPESPTAGPDQPSYRPPGSDQPDYGPAGGDQPRYAAPSTPDQSFGQTPSYGAPGQGSDGQPPSAGSPYGGAPQGGYDPNAGYGAPTQDAYGQPPGASSPYGGAPQGGYDPNAGYGAPGQYGAPGGQYGAPSPYGGGYEPNPYASGPVLATWPRRAIGGLIDFVVPGIVIGIVVSLVVRNGGFAGNLLGTVLSIGWWVYNSGYRMATTGYSFGQKIGKVRVVMENTGQTPPQNTAMMRAAAHFLDSLICGLGFLFPLWDAKKQTFADKIAKTVVIDEQNLQR